MMITLGGRCVLCFTPVPDGVIHSCVAVAPGSVLPPPRFDRFMPYSPPLALSLEPRLRCPNASCGKYAYGLAVDQAVTPCSKCKGHWWATRVRPGNARTRILNDYAHDAAVDRMIDLVGMPAQLDVSLYWQLMLTNTEARTFIRRCLAFDFQVATREFFRERVAVLRVA